MMLHDFVGRFPEAWSPRTFPFPAECQMAQVRLQLEDPSDGPEIRIIPVDLEALTQDLRLCHQQGVWSELSPRQWRYSSECLCLGTPRLIDDPGFVEAYLAGLKASSSFTVTVNHLVRCYLKAFAPDEPALVRISAFILTHLATIRAKWRDLHGRHRLFLPDQTDGAIAVDFLAGSDDAPAFLARRGYPAAALSWSLFAFAYVEVCRRTSRASGTPTLAHLTRLWQWGVVENRLRYADRPGTVRALAEALLLPWTGRFPEEAIRTFVVRLLVGLVGDPRAQNPVWLEIGQPARDVLLRWITKDALEQFFDVVDHTVQPHQRRMWSTRRDYWLSYDQAELIKESWVVFGRRGAALARMIAAERDQPALAHFGTLVRDVGGDPSQAVLLMKIGPLTIADLSHNGRCHIWLPGNAAAPQLYQAEYLRDELTQGADFETTHYKEWQAEVRAFIARSGILEGMARA